jgi:transposase
MINCGHESLFPRFAATSVASHRPGKEPVRGRRDVCHFYSHDQALSQSTTREWTGHAQTDPGSAQHQRSGLAGGPARTARSQPRCQSRAALPDVVRADWHQGQHCVYQPHQSSFGLDAKKKTLRASEQNEEARIAWRQQATSLPSLDLVFVDETGSHIAMTPLYAYAPRGQRAISKIPRNYGAIMSLIASISMQGMGEALMLDGAADGAAFESYVEQILAPSLRPGQMVILDNLSIHLGARVRQAIEERSCRLLFLPAYSPDFSPIEEAFSKLKAFLRREGARTREALQEAIAAALDLITAQDARGWFTHCGYPPPLSTEMGQ